MSQRDEQAREWMTTEIADEMDGLGLSTDPRLGYPARITDRILADFDRLAGLLGYSRPRVVETEAELDALPEDSIVLDACGCAYRKDGPGRTVWLGFGDEGTLDWTCVDLPAAVLWMPGEAK